MVNPGILTTLASVLAAAAAQQAAQQLRQAPEPVAVKGSTVSVASHRAR